MSLPAIPFKDLTSTQKKHGDNIYCFDQMVFDIRSLYQISQSKWDRQQYKISIKGTVRNLNHLPLKVTVCSTLEFHLWGLSFIKKYMGIWYSYGVNLPRPEHVDIFPVRLVSTFHRVFSVYLTLAVCLT